MKPPFLLERLWWAAGSKLSRTRRKSGRSFYRQYMSWDAPNAGIGFVIWISLLFALVTAGVYGAEAVGILQFGASDDQIKQAYQEVLHREPDAEGLKTYQDSGMDYEHIKEDLNNSAEKKAMSQ